MSVARAASQRAARPEPLVAGRELEIFTNKLARAVCLPSETILAASQPGSQARELKLLSSQSRAKRKRANSWATSESEARARRSLARSSPVLSCQANGHYKQTDSLERLLHLHSLASSQKAASVNAK